MKFFYVVLASFLMRKKGNMPQRLDLMKFFYVVLASFTSYNKTKSIIWKILDIEAFNSCPFSGTLTTYPTYLVSKKPVQNEYRTVIYFALLDTKYLLVHVNIFFWSDTKTTMIKK